MSKDTGVVFILGAGFSVPAGLKDITDITNDFLKDLDNNELEWVQELKEKINSIWEVTNTHFIDRKDLESFLTLLRMLEDPEDSKLLSHTYEELKGISNNDIEIIKSNTQRYIRTKLENRIDIEFLKNLQGFPYPLTIFTLNYDSVIDVFCEMHDIHYTDGFNPYWNSRLFSDPEYQIKLYRIHGSLYWLRTATGKTLKVPIKGLDIEKLRYISDDGLSEMIIYPTIQKDKYSEIYSWLTNQFISVVKESRLCVIIGYSLRDRDIRDNIIDAIRINKGLFILIISPHASSRIQYFEGLTEEELSRIGHINARIENLFLEATLYTTIQNLTGYMKYEGYTLKDIYTSSTVSLKDNRDYNTKMEMMLRCYIENGFETRARYLFDKYGYTMHDNNTNAINTLLRSK